MKEIISDSRFVSMCGLYCGACGSFKKGKCPGCAENTKATWCKVYSCCMEKGYASCADCQTYANPMDCKYYNNVMASIFGFIFRSDRKAGIAMIKEKGYDGFARHMADNGLQAIRRK